MIIIFLWTIIIKSYKIITENTVNLSEKYFGYDDQINNSFSVSFLMKIENNKCDTNITFLEMYINYEILVIFNLNCVDPNSIILENNADSSRITDLELNKIYLFKFKYNKENSKYYLNIYYLDNYENTQIINKEYNSEIDFSKTSDLFIIFNSKNHEIKIILEQIVIYYDINEIDDYTVPSYNLYFINFRHNIISSKYIMNEYNNEFGYSINGGTESEYFTKMSSIYDEETKEVIWVDNKFGFIDINKVVFIKILNLSLYKSHFIYIKFDIGVVYNKTDDINDFTTTDNYILSYDNNHLLKYDVMVDNKIFEIKIKFKNNIIFNNWKKLNEGNFYKDGKIGLNFIYLKLINKINTNYFTSIWGYGYRKNLNTSGILKEVKSDEIELTGTINNVKYFSYNNNGTSMENLFRFYFIHKEFVVGVGELKLKDNKIISNNKDRYFVFYNSDIDDLERRFFLKGDLAHRSCMVINCSICRNNIDKCEYCYQNYYITTPFKCIENSDDSKFVNNYSWINDVNPLNNNNNYSNTEYLGTNLPTFNFEYYTYKFIDTNKQNFNYFIFFNYENNFSINQTSNLIIKYKEEYINVNLKLFNNINYSDSIIWTDNSHKIIDIGFIKNLNKGKFKFIILKAMCNIYYTYVNIPCNKLCRLDSNEYYFFYHNKVTYGYCYKNLWFYYYRNNDYKIYTKCPKNCYRCNLDTNNLIICTICFAGYFLSINKYCNKFNFLNIHKTNKVNTFYHDKWTSCKNKNAIYCHLKYSEKIITPINCKEDYFLNEEKSSCISLIEDKNCIKIKLSKCIECKNNTLTWVNNICKSCSNIINNCITCSNINTCSSCADKYFLKNNSCVNCSNNCLKCNDFNNCTKCISSYNIINGFCKNFILVANCIIYSNETNLCTKCETGYILNNLICNKNLVDNCITYSNETNLCTRCETGYILNNLICNKNLVANCITYSNETNLCTKCETGYILIDNQCLKCNLGCETCLNSQNYCIKCLDNYYLNNYKCINKFIEDCLNYSEDKINCIKCKKGFSLIIFQNRTICSIKCKIHEYKNKLGLCVKCVYPYIILDKLNNKDYNIIIMDLPSNIWTSNLNQDLIKIKLNIKQFNQKINIKNKKLIISIKNVITYKYSFNINITIENQFTQNNCYYKYIQKNFTIPDYKPNIKEYKSDNILNLAKISPQYDENSTEYKIINNLSFSTQATVLSLSVSSFFLSLIIIPLLKYLSMFLEFLLVIRISTLLKINFGLMINTVFYLLNFNTNIIVDITKYINLNDQGIRNSLLMTINPKFLKEDLSLITNFNMIYLLGYFLFIIYLILKIINFFIDKYHSKQRKKHIYPWFSKTIFIKKINSINLIVKFKRFEYFILYYYLNIIFLEFPNILFTSYIYIFSYDLINYNGYFNNINIFWITNFFIITHFMFYNIYIINEFKILDVIKTEKKIIYEFLIPYQNKGSIILYYMILENFRTMFNLVIILYFNSYLILQIVFILVLQLIIFIIMLNSVFPKKIDKSFFILKELLNLLLLILLSVKGIVEIDFKIYDYVVIFIFCLLILLVFFKFLYEFVNITKFMFKKFLKFMKKYLCCCFN